MLKSNKSSSSLTPIETNTETEYGVGFYDIPTVSNTATNLKTSPKEGSNTVKIRVMDSERNEADDIDFYDGGDDNDDDNDGDEDNDYEDDVDNDDDEESDNDDEVDENKHDDTDQIVSNFVGDGKGDNQNENIAQAERSETPVGQHIVDNSNESSDGILPTENDKGDISEKLSPSKDGNVGNENHPSPQCTHTDVHLETNVQSEQSQNIHFYQDKNRSSERGDDESNKEPIMDAEGKLINDDELNSVNNENNLVSTSNELEILPKDSGGHVIDKDINHIRIPSTKSNGDEPNDPQEVAFDDEKNITSQTHSTRSDGLEKTDRHLGDDFFDRTDSVEMSYFASFNETESSNEKVTNTTGYINRTRDDEDQSKNTDRISETEEIISDPAGQINDSDENPSTFCKSGIDNDKLFPTASGHSIPVPDTAKQDQTEECAQDNLKSASVVNQDIQLTESDANAKNQDENSLRKGTKSPEEIKSEQNDSNVDCIEKEKEDTKMNDHDKTRNSSDDPNDKIACTKTIFTDTNVPIQNVLPKDNISGKNDHGDGSDNNENEDDDGDDSGSQGESGRRETEESNLLSEPDEQSILRVYISKEQPEFDITSELSEDAQNNENVDVDFASKQNSKRSKPTSKSAKHTQKDKKKNQSSPYSNPAQTYKFDNDSRAIERLKYGPYAEVFKRDAPKVPSKSKNGQESNKKNKSNEKPKSQSAKRDKRTNTAVRSPSKMKVKRKAESLTNKMKQKGDFPEEDAPSLLNSLHEDSEEEPPEQNRVESNGDNLSSAEKGFELKQSNSEETVCADDYKSTEVVPESTVVDYSPKGVVIHDSLLASQQCESVPEVNVEKTLPEASSVELQKQEPCDDKLFATNECTKKDTSVTTDDNTKITDAMPSNSQPEEKTEYVDNIDVITEPMSHDPPPDEKNSIEVTHPKVINSTREESEAKAEAETKTLNDIDNPPIADSGIKVTATKITKTNTDKEKQSSLRASSAKKKIIISSPKTTAKMAMKSKQMSEKPKNSQKTQITKTNQKSNQKSKERKISDGKNSTNDSNNQMDILTPTTITVIDETSELDEKVKGKAGQLIINNIKNKLRKNSIKRHTSNSSVASVQLITNSRPSSPDEKGLNSSIAHQGGRPAYKTQSMSSLQVPGHLSTSNPWDPTKEEDAISIGSRRPSMDSVSRKSVDYRIRNTTMVIQPNNDEKPKSVFTSDETYIQTAVPCLPMSLAVFCFILNVIVPGSGTIISGLSVLCCGHSRLSNKEDQMLNSLCANLFVGIAQLFTVSFLLVGWFWSISWGIKMVSVSAKHREELRQQREKDLQAMALSAFGSPKRMNLFSV